MPAPINLIDHDWSAGVVKPLMEEHPYAWVYFVVFILASTFMALNLFIGVVVGALDAETAAEAPKLTHAAGSEERVLEELKALRGEVMLLRAEMTGSRPQQIRRGVHAA